MASVTDEQLREEVERIVMACLADPLARLSERGCEPPYEMTLLDEDGTAAIGLIDENEEAARNSTGYPNSPSRLRSLTMSA